MDPCPFVRLIVESLALKLPTVTRSAGPGVHPTTSTCFCTLQLLLDDGDSPPTSDHCQTAPVPLSGLPISDPNLTADVPLTVPPSSSPVVFSIDPAKLRSLSVSGGRSPAAGLAVSVYAAGGRSTGGSGCGLTSRSTYTSGGRRLVGKVRVAVDLQEISSVSRAMVVQSGWVSLQGSGRAGRGRRAGRLLHMVVRSEPDPRFVFEFGGEAECSPVVYQLVDRRTTNTNRQPLFTCRFNADRRRRRSTRSLPTDSSNKSSTRIKAWLASQLLGNQRDMQVRKEEQRKGWTVTIHDLSGSPVAAASMITPFVPSPGSDRVSRSNPGAWLILRATAGGPSTSNWKPWARLEAWRERGSGGGPVDASLGYKLELVMELNGSSSSNIYNGGSVLIAESSLSVRKGGQFRIEYPPSGAAIVPSSPVPFVGGGGGGSFVMECSVQGEGKVSKPTVQVGVQHVSCMGDVALFIALSAAIDLSMDACQLFSHKLRKELCQDQQEYTL